MKNVSVKKVVKSVRGAKPAKGIKGTKDGAKTVKAAKAVRGVKAVRGAKNARKEEVVGVENQPAGEADFLWYDDQVAKGNYEELGKRLSLSGDLFRSSKMGLIQLLPKGKHDTITKGSDLSPVIVDRVNVRVMRGGKINGSRINGVDLKSMLRAECFLSQFRPVDRVTPVPHYRPDFSRTVPGFNDGGDGHRILYVGEVAAVSDNLDTINSFLDVMAFETNADRTNTVAAALTVLLHDHWPGGKPIILATATKSHAGKDTVIRFATGMNKSVSISYQSTDWAVERNFVGAIKTNPDAAVVVIENARLGREKVIASAIIERFATDPEPQLFSTGTGSPTRIRNDLVQAISTNFGTVSEDISNRALPIHLNPVGDIQDRKSPIGNPRQEFLPANEQTIAAELRGMVESWKAAGRPLDENVRHPFSPWAKTVGGILKVNGFTDFLANYGSRKSAADPIRHGLGILGASQPDKWLDAGEWAQNVMALGLEKAVIPPADQGSDAGRKRGIGAVLSNHRGERLDVQTDDATVVMELERIRRRWGGGEPQVKYQFKTIESKEVSE